MFIQLDLDGSPFIQLPFDYEFMHAFFLSTDGFGCSYKYGKCSSNVQAGNSLFCKLFLSLLHLKHSSFRKKRKEYNYEKQQNIDSDFFLLNEFSELKAVLRLKIENDCIT